MFEFQQGGLLCKNICLFCGTAPFYRAYHDEILSILHCVSAAKITRPRGSYIFRAGDSTEVMGLVLSGSTLVIQEDLWGHRNILSKCNTGDFFGELTPPLPVPS